MALKSTRQRGWKPGVSGNSAGKPKGARHRTTLAIESLLEGEAEGLTRKAIEMALAGDNVAMRLCLDRLAPPRKDRTLSLDIPTIVTAGDAVAASASIIDAVAAGQITPGEGSEFGKLLDTHTRAIEVAELDVRVRDLEAQLASMLGR